MNAGGGLAAYVTTTAGYFGGVTTTPMVLAQAQKNIVLTYHSLFVYATIMVQIPGSTLGNVSTLDAELTEEEEWEQCGPTTTAFNSTLSSLWSMSGTIQAIRSASAEACAPLARSRRAIRSASAEAPACAAGLTESGMLMSHPSD